MFRFVLAALAFSLATVGFAAAPAKEAASTAPAAKLKAALDDTGDVVFEDKSLVDVVAYFKSKLKADVRYDNAALMSLGIDPSAIQFNVKQRGGKIRDGLKAALATVNLHYGIVGGSIVIGPEDAVIAQQMRQRVSVDGEATTLATLLKSLANDTGANLVVDPRIEAKAQTAAVKLKLDDVPLETAVRLTVEVAGYATVRMNNVLFVTSEERAEKLKAVADAPVPATSPSPPLGVLPDIGPGVPARAVPPPR